MQNKILKAVLTVIVTVLAGVGIFLVLTTEVPTIATDINANTIIRANQITNKRVVKTSVNKNAVTRDVELVGKKTLIDLKAGSQVLSTQITDTANEVGNTEVGEDMTILSIGVTDGSAPADIKAGDLINILAYFQSGAVAGQSSFITGYNTIYTVNKVNVDKETGITRSIDIVVPKKEAVSVQVASTMGRIFLIKNSNKNDINLGTMGIEEVYMQNVYNKIIEDDSNLENTVDDSRITILNDEDLNEDEIVEKEICETTYGASYEKGYELNANEEWVGGITYCHERRNEGTTPATENEIKLD